MERFTRYLMQARWSLLLLTLFFSMVISASWCQSVVAEITEEDKIKVAFLYHFAKFVTWPEAAFGNGQTDLTLCFFGSGSLKDAVSSLQGKLIKGRKLNVEQRTDAHASTNCQIAFVGKSDQQLHHQLLATTQGAPVLTISDNIDQFTHQGGILNVISSARKIQFEISELAAERAGLKISSQLLELRIRVDARLP